MQQIHYLEDLKKAPKKWGTVARIAETHGVTHATVSRFFRSCQQAGYLEENYELTEKGEEWLGYCQDIRKGLADYLKNLGVPQKDIEKNVCIMEEQMDAHVLKAILTKARNQERNESANEFRKSDIRRISLEGYMEKGEYQVEFILLKYRQNGAQEYELSMADRGFEKPAKVGGTG